MHSRFLALALSVFGTGLAPVFGLALPAQSQDFREWTASRRAVNTCVWVAQSQGFPVLEVLNQNDYAGGSKVVMRVQERYGSTTLGCDYASTGRVQIYRLVEPKSDWSADRYGRYDRGYWNRWSNGWDSASDNRWNNDRRYDRDWNNRDWNGRDDRDHDHRHGSWNDDRHRDRWSDHNRNDGDS